MPGTYKRVKCSQFGFVYYSTNVILSLLINECVKRGKISKRILFKLLFFKRTNRLNVPCREACGWYNVGRDQFR